MSDYPDWQADNQPMRAALSRLHSLHRTTGQIIPEAKEQFFATLQEAYFLIPTHGNIEDENGKRRISFYFEPTENGLMLSVFSSVSQARAYFGADAELHRVIQSVPDFFGSLVNMAEILRQGGNDLTGVVLDRASENSYFFNVPEIVSLSAGGRVIGPLQQVSIENQQIQIASLPDPSPLSPQLVRAFQEVVIEARTFGVGELWAFWMTIDGKSAHLGLAIACEGPAAIGHVGSQLEAKWQEFGPRYAAFDLMPLVGSQEATIRTVGELLWQREPPQKLPEPSPKRPFWRRLRP